MICNMVLCRGFSFFLFLSFIFLLVKYRIPSEIVWLLGWDLAPLVWDGGRGITSHIYPWRCHCVLLLRLHRRMQMQLQLQL